MATNNTLVRRLRRELTANPKKAALLGLLFLVAVWFWAPLIGKWMGKKTPTENATVAVIDNELAAPTGTVETANKTKTNAPTWRQILSWISDEPLMKPHAHDSAGRDPFAPAISEAVAKDDAPKSEPPPEVTPQQAGLALHSTVVGSQTSTALINGRAYRENQTIVAPNGRTRFILVEIRRNSVVLEHQGKRYQLKLPKVEMAGLND